MLMISDQVVVKLTDTILLSLPAIIASIGTLIVSLRNSKKTEEVKKMVNGRMDELIQKTQEVAHRDGKEAGIKEATEGLQK